MVDDTTTTDATSTDPDADPDDTDAASTDPVAQRAILHGPDEHGLAEALVDAGAAVERLHGPTDADALGAAGIAAADLFVLTDVAEAAAIPVAKEHNPDVRAVVYADGSLPEFVTAVVDVAVDPALLPAAAVAEELVGR